MQIFSLTWIVISVCCTFWLVKDLRHQPEIMSMMKIAWILITLYLGFIGIWLYHRSCREPEPGTHDAFVAPMWKQSVGSVMHCVAGDALGIVAASTVATWLRLPESQSMVVEYIAGFLMGWLFFQTIPMMKMNGTTFKHELKTAFFAEFLSLTFMVIGMFPTMAYFMRIWHVMSAVDLRFWLIMSISILIGSIVTYPINWWMVRRGMKHGMGSSHVLGHGGNHGLHQEVHTSEHDKDVAVHHKLSHKH
ncbi:DUF4396 domain-containing protein [Ferroacidibacillus organovorans]|uniref:DUF4396 domain-containing protein n=3 Tax=Ferroacidibacillus organovorans TaxID=1765683 RepID=A0A101XTF4_9BACL|nr:DUF4396 domain-containing protein [Ferroacidibacillus organovorans]KUO97254.1 hypothetical protein ATW55_11720 [Ferroacidibacillus organovorans]KYP80228.1 hypothetical protein AYJ22_12225 [Ferroacidibacillus organovorans]OAG93611.1 hypothetical protein AYW79_09645 [Ferroacidibacillus organovorans]OPG17102.1 hypothetical protein B2M26_03295 [Ferroacidibacillus organovorans]